MFIVKTTPLILSLPFLSRSLLLSYCLSLSLSLWLFILLIKYTNLIILLILANEAGKKSVEAAVIEAAPAAVYPVEKPESKQEETPHSDAEAGIELKTSEMASVISAVPSTGSQIGMSSFNLKYFLLFSFIFSNSLF